MVLEFLGIDTFSEVFLNGQYLGETNNMFRQYSFDVSSIVREGDNELVVCIRSIRGKMKQYPEEGYFGCFNVQHGYLFVRLSATFPGIGHRTFLQQVSGMM